MGAVKVQVDPTPDPEVIRAAGGLVWWGAGRAARLALVHRPRYGDWSLPKGKLKDGESWEEAAVREVKEETGCDVEITGFAGTVSYLVNGRPKVVLFWNMRRVGDCSFRANKEVDQIVWLSRRQAIRRLNHQIEGRLLNG